MRYWLEYNKTHGFRLVSQSSNPKKGHIWNKPKTSTYAKFGGCMYLDDDNHVQWAGLSEYSDATEALAFQQTYGEGVPERLIMDKWVAAKVAYEAICSDGDPLRKGVPEARTAWNETK
jgi:hypothetical protein